MQVLDVDLARLFRIEHVEDAFEILDLFTRVLLEYFFVIGCLRLIHVSVVGLIVLELDVFIKFIVATLLVVLINAGVIFLLLFIYVGLLLFLVAHLV